MINRPVIKKTFWGLVGLILCLVVALVWTNLRVVRTSESGVGYRLTTLQQQIEDQQVEIENQKRKAEWQQEITRRLVNADQNRISLTVYGDKSDMMVSNVPFTPFTGAGPSATTYYGSSTTCTIGDQGCETVYLVKQVDGKDVVFDSISLTDLGVKPGDEVEAWYAAELTGNETLVPSSPRNGSPAYWRASTGLAIAITHVDGSASGAVIK